MKGTENFRNKTLRAVERIARNEVEKHAFGWPPVCAGIYHQPKRPVQQKEKSI